MRSASTYRAARRNETLRGEAKMLWSRHHYHDTHRANDLRRTVLSRKPSKYHPLKAMRGFLRSFTQSPYARHVLNRAPIPKKRAPGRGRLSIARDSSLRKVMRRAARLGEAVMPSVEAKQRHHWFRKEVGSAALRVHLGQELDGDQDLLKAASG